MSKHIDERRVYIKENDKDVLDGHTIDLRFSELKGFVADIQAALRSLDTASGFYPKEIDSKPFRLSPEDARELDTMLSGIRSDLARLELGIYGLASRIVESTKEGILKKVSDAIVEDGRAPDMRVDG